MNKEELLKKLDNAVVHCPAVQLAQSVCDKFHNIGLSYTSGAPFNEEVSMRWRCYRDATCYYISDFGGDECAQFCSRSYYEDMGCKIISARTFLSWFEDEKSREKSNQFENALESIRNYFGKNDRTTFEHWADRKSVV